MTMNLYTAKIVFNGEANPNCPDILLEVTLQCGGYTYISDDSYGDSTISISAVLISPR